jgi:ferredoxin
MARRHVKTKFIDIDKEKCSACGKCVEACPSLILKIVGFKFIIHHQHVNIIDPGLCTGCLSCVTACTENAINKI